ncbi:hypothetical protein XI08_36125 [Bradyrhizobium sp. CCBAU 11361]|nr:hypothetical protein [Bradyrhizobium sp. CCBAU 11361]
MGVFADSGSRVARNSAAPIARGATDCDTVHIRADGSALWFICRNQPPFASILTRAPARALLARASDHPGASARNRIFALLLASG